MGAGLRRGSRLGKYRLERRIGQGAFADVWAARDTIEARKVALKVAWPEMVELHGKADFEREARITAHLEHPNVVGVRNADWIDGRFVMATELAKANLADYKAARRSAETALRIIRDVAAGLAYAHGQRLVHRDVKPDNILIFPDGRAALTDFGVSKLKHGETRGFTEAGTLGYMAPEQAYGRPSFSSDVFSIGLIAYELLTGKCPRWPFEWPFAGHRQFVAKVPAPVQPVLRRACAFDPAKRYADGIQLHRALEAAFAKVEAPRRRRRTRKRSPDQEASPLEVQAEVFRKRYGTSLRLRFACRRCGGPISEAMHHCPWCGTHDNSFAEVTKAPLICPHCERGVEAAWTACPWCYKGRFEGNGRPPRKDPRAVRTCAKPGCAGQLRRFMRYCPICKTKPKRPPTHRDLPDKCPRCRWPVSRAFWPFCPWCGRREPKAARFK